VSSENSPVTASTADAIIPFDALPLRFEDADAVLLLAEDPDLVDLAEVLEPALLDEEADFSALVRELEVVLLAFDEDDPALDPDLEVLDAVPLLLADDVFVFVDPPDIDLEFPDDRPAVFFVGDELLDDLLDEREDVEVDFDFEPDADDFVFDAEDFDPPAFDAADFEELDLEPDAFLVVAMIFLRVIE